LSTIQLYLINHSTEILRFEGSSRHLRLTSPPTYLPILRIIWLHIMQGRTQGGGVWTPPWIDIFVGFSMIYNIISNFLILSYMLKRFGPPFEKFLGTLLVYVCVCVCVLPAVSEKFGEPSKWQSPVLCSIIFLKSILLCMIPAIQFEYHRYFI